MSSPSLSQNADFRRLVDSVEGVAVWFVAEMGEFQYVSEGFESIWSFPPEETQANPSRFVESIHPEDREVVLDQMETPPDQVTEVTYVARVVQPDGAVRWVQTRQVPLRDEAGLLRHIVGISTDITVQKRREAEFETLNRIVRHDIRNDTSVILGWAELLGDHVDEEGTAHLEKIVSAGEQIVELTDVAGTYAVAVAGRESMVVTPVSLRPTLTDEILIRSETYPAAEISLVGEIPDVEVLAKELLQSVFRNLLNNAIQHNDKATPRVTLSCSTTEETVTVEVADNGPGIPEESKESVFGKGVSGLASSGSGVGLSLVRGLVDQYNGVFPSGTTIRRARCSR